MTPTEARTVRDGDPLVLTTCPRFGGDPLMLDDLAIGSIATASTRLYDSSQHVSVPYDPADGTMCVDFSGFPCWIDIECLDRAAIPDLHDPAALEAWLSESH